MSTDATRLIGEQVTESAPEGAERDLSDRPWMTAPGESWWVATGRYDRAGSFTQCLAQVVPSYVTGVPEGEGEPLFLVHVWGDYRPVHASNITAAKRLVFVGAETPAVAYYADEQTFLDNAQEAIA